MTTHIYGLNKLKIKFRDEEIDLKILKSLQKVDFILFQSIGMWGV
jgi:hypothetical protein